MDETDHALFPRFSAELVATALKDTPVSWLRVRVSVARPHWFAIWSRAIANSSPWTTTQFWPRHAATPLGWCVLSIERPLTKYSECPTFSGLSRSQWMMIAGPAGFC
jgi:hypothetical protein